MLLFIARFKNGITLSVIILIMLSTIAGQVPAPDQSSLLTWSLYTVVSPFQQLGAYIVIGFQEIWDNYIDLRSVRSQNETLVEEVKKLTRDNQRLRETLAMVGGEQELLAFMELYYETYQYEAIPALVIGAGSSRHDHTVLLNKGSLHGVRQYQGVISPTGVVGKVIRVGSTTSLVQLITDRNFSMAARVQSSRVRGIVAGSGGNTCELNFIRDTDPVALNDRIVSSGLERVFPRGLLVGKITEIDMEEPPLRKIHVQPSAELSSLEWVIIVSWHDETQNTEGGW